MAEPVNRQFPHDEHTENRKEFVRQFPKNLGSNIALFLINIAVGVWLIPYYIHHLGVATYGLIPLASSLTQYVALITLAISSGLSRFLTIDLQQKNLERANQTFNTSFWSLLAIILVTIPFFYVFIQFLPMLFKVPAQQITSSKWLFTGAFIAFLLTTLSSCFNTSTFAYNRLDLRNLVQIVRYLARVGLIVFLFSVFNPSLEIVAIATLFAAFIGFTMDYLFWRKITPDLRVSFSSFDKSRLKDITSLGGWHLVNHLATLLILQIDLIIVNRLFGPTAGGEYASILQWSLLIRTMSKILGSTTQPMLMICYAQNNINDFINITKMSIKVVSCGLALPVGLACGFAPELLTLWIGPEFDKLAPLMILMLFHLPMNLAEVPLYSVYLCYNKLKISGIVTLFIGIFNLILAVSIPLLFETGFYGVAIAGAIALTLKCTIFAPWYAAYVMDLPKNTFFIEIVKGLLAVSIVIFTSVLVRNIWHIDTWIKLFSFSLLLGCVYSGCIWRYTLSWHERKLVKRMMTGIASISSNKKR